MIRTGYSFKVAYGHLPDVMSRLHETGWHDVAPIADRDSTFGFVRWSKLAKDRNKRPIYGVELAVTPDKTAKKPPVDYWTFLARGSLHELNRLVYMATRWDCGQGPVLNYAEAMAAKDVFKITGSSLLLDHVEPADDLFVGLSPATPLGLIKDARQKGLNFLARSCNVYPRERDLETYRIALGRRSNTQTYPQHILSDDEWHLHMGENKFVPRELRERAFTFRNLVLSNCLAELKPAELLVPEKTMTLREMCERGAKDLGCDLNDPFYAQRLDRELSVIAEKKFEDYFFIIADLVAYAKKHMIVGPARGSSCGSLVCYLTGITTIDPIPYGLLFERFIDLNRSDLPDIDIDLSEERRDMALNYIKTRYGSNRVARLGTVGVFRAKSALNQVGLTLRIPKWIVKKVQDSVVEHDDADRKSDAVLQETLETTAAGAEMLGGNPAAIKAVELENHPTHASQHAAGMVLTRNTLIDSIAIDARTDSVMCDMRDAVDLNMLKIDTLGLTQLSVFERTLELIGKPSRNDFLAQIPLNDHAAFDILNHGRFAGIFQFSGNALKQLTMKVRVYSLEDMVSLTALARPGPMASGGTNSWVERKNHRETPYPVHRFIADITENTLGVIVYQEQVMQIVRKMGNLSWEDTSAIRKAMGKSMGSAAMDKYRDKFIVGAIENGINGDEARQVWEKINTYGAYGFNKSHAVAYAVVSYWCCWLKAHHPMQFAAATLDNEKDPEKQISILKELEAEGVGYIAVDVEHSRERWWFKKGDDGKDILVGPLTAIEGIGPQHLREIITCRETGQKLRAPLEKMLESARTKISSLSPIADAAAPLLGAKNVVSMITPIEDIQCGIQDEVIAVGVLTRINPVDENSPEKVAKRKWKYNSGPTTALNMFLRDDSDEIFCKVDRLQYSRIGTPIVDKGGVGKALYAIKGTVPRGFRMISVTDVRYLGELE